MKRTYERSEAEALLPLLNSILREIEDRTKDLMVLDKRLGPLARRLGRQHPEVANVMADIAVHKRELRHAQKELELLGCTLEDAGSLGVRIPAGGDGSFLWQPGRPLQAEVPTAA